MAVNLSPIWGAGAQLLDNSGNVLSGGKIYTYAAGTTTPATTFTNSSAVTANSNPIVLNAAGRVPYEIWMTDGISYKFVLKDSNDTLIGTYDNLIGINSNFVAFTSQQEIQTATAGQTVFNLTTMQYTPGVNNLTVYVDGVNQYGPGAQYAFVETDTDTVTFVSGLHVGASVKFTTATPINSGATDAEFVSYNPPFTGAVGTNVELKLAQTVSVKDFGAVGDGITDDSAAIQAALDAVADGGNLYFPPGEYFCPYTRSDGNTLVLEAQSVTGDYPVSYTNQPIRLIGNGAILKADPITGDDVIFLNIVGAQNVEVTGLVFVGTRIPNDTEISVFGNTLLYFSYCQNVTVTNNKFINCNGAGVYYFVNNFIVSNNIFQTTNGGCQGNYSKNVQISNNIFRCYAKCDDQIGIFSDVSRDSGNVTIVGNTVDKGYDGSKGTGGTTRGWARCIIIAGSNTRDVLIAGNNLLNNNSTDPADRTGTSGAAIILETDAIYRCKISANRISNCRLGIIFASKSDISITDNEFDLIESTVIQGTNAINGYVTIDNNVFNNCGTSTTSDVIVYVYNWGTGACSVSGNKFFRCTSFITMNLGSATTFQTGQLTVMNNVENQSTDVTAVSNSAFCRIGYVNRTEVVNNTTKKLCQTSIAIANRGDYAEISGNTIHNYSVYAIDVDTIYTGLSGMVISNGNFALSSTAAYSGRDRMLKMLAGVGALNGAGNYARYLTSDSYGQGVYYGNAGEITSTTGANFQIGDKLYYNSVTSGGYIGQVCTTAGAPGTWKTFGVIS